jgi:hypothetical protein
VKYVVGGVITIVGLLFLLVRILAPAPARYFINGDLVTCMERELTYCGITLRYCENGFTYHCLESVAEAVDEVKK